MKWEERSTYQILWGFSVCSSVLVPRCPLVEDLPRSRRWLVEDIPRSRRWLVEELTRSRRLLVNDLTCFPFSASACRRAHPFPVLGDCLSMISPVLGVCLSKSSPASRSRRLLVNDLTRSRRRLVKVLTCSRRLVKDLTCFPFSVPACQCTRPFSASIIVVVSRHLVVRSCCLVGGGCRVWEGGL